MYQSLTVLKAPTMRAVLIFAGTLAVCYGLVEWTDFRAGKSGLPRTETDAVAAGWNLVEADTNLQITWYSQDSDPRLFLAYDRRQKCAGIRVAFLESDIDKAYLAAYEKNGLFEKGTYYGKKIYYSTVLFSPETLLTSGGRRMLATDEVALGVFVKRQGTYHQLDREGCENAKHPFVEQACQSGYGLLFSKFGSKSKCDSLVPFYAVFDPEEDGDLIAFGWISYSKLSSSDYKTKTFYKTLSSSSFKALFPHAPACLLAASQNGFTAVDIWLSYESGLKTVCTPGNWTESHCQVKNSVRPGIWNGGDDADPAEFDD